MDHLDTTIFTDLITLMITAIQVQHKNSHTSKNFRNLCHCNCSSYDSKTKNI